MQRPCCLLLLALALFGLVSACTPRVTPLYRDYSYAVDSVSTEEVRARIAAALEEAGWKVVPAATPHAVATDSRKLSEWGLYKVVAWMEAVPMGDRYVRLFVHPYRVYITRGRSKIPLLPYNIEKAIYPPLNREFRARGLVLVGTPFDKDKTRVDE